MNNLTLSEIETKIKEGSFDRALELIENYSPNSNEGKVKIFVFQLSIYAQRQEYPQLHSLCQEKLEKINFENFPLDKIQALILWARSLSRIGQVAEAYKRIKEAHSMFYVTKKDEEIKTHYTLGELNELEIELLHRKGEIDCLVGNYTIAVEGLNKCLARIDKSKEVERYSIINSVIGLTYHMMGEFSKAIRIFEENLDIYKESGDNIKAGKTYINISNQYSGLGEFYKSIQYAKKGLSILEKSLDKPSRFRILNSIATSYNSLGEVEIAESYYLECLSLAKKLQYPMFLAHVHHNIGTLYKSSNKLELAANHFQQSLEISEEENLIYETMASVYELLELYVFKGELDKAKEYYQIIISNRESIEGKVLNAVVKISEAIMLKETGGFQNLAKAQDLFEQITIEKEVEDSILKKAYLELVDIYLQSYKLSRTPDKLKKIKDLLAKLYTTAENNNLISLKIELLVLQSRIEALNSNFQVSEELMREAISLAQEKQYYLYQNTASRYYDDLLPLIQQHTSKLEPEILSSESQSMFELENLLRTLKSGAFLELDIEEDIPVAFIIYRETHGVVYNYEFRKDDMELIDDELFPRIIQTIQSFVNSDEFDPMKTERFYFNNHLALFKMMQEFTICYVMRGKSFSAFYKLDTVVNFMHSSSEIMELMRSGNIRKEIKVKDLEILIKNIFQGSNIPPEQINQVEDYSKNYVTKAAITNDKMKMMIHPVRLGIIKLLATNVYLPRNVLQKSLNVPSGTLERHLETLEEEKLVDSFFEMINARPNKILQITLEGRNYYQNLLHYLSN